VGPQGLSKQLEKRIREALKKLDKEFGIQYVHDKGKKMETPSGDTVVPDIYFRTKDKAYVGDVKITNENTIINIENLKKIAKIKKDEENRNVIKFLVSNISNADIPSEIKVFKIENHRANRIIQGDEELLLDELKTILKELVGEETVRPNQTASPNIVFFDL
jgi:hypothetical protein